MQIAVARQSENEENTVIRRLSTFVLTLVALVSFVNVGHAQQPLMTRHTREEVASRAVPLVGHMSATQNLRIVLVLQHRNQSELDQLLSDLYDSSSPSYRHFLTVEQFTEKFGPTREDYEAVKSWARQNGLRIESTSRNRMILPVSGSVQNIEKALHVTMGVYQHPTENRTFFAPDREPMPNTPVRLWSIGGLDNFSRPTPQVVRRDANTRPPDGVIDNATTGSCPGKSFCGSDMRAAYYGGTALTGAGQSVVLFEFIGTDLTDLIDNATTGSCPGKSFCGSDMRAAYYGGTALTGAGQSVVLFEFIGTDLTDLIDNATTGSCPGKSFCGSDMRAAYYGGT